MTRVNVNTRPVVKVGHQSRNKSGNKNGTNRGHKGDHKTSIKTNIIELNKHTYIRIESKESKEFNKLISY